MGLSSDLLDHIARLRALTHLSINLKKLFSSAWETPELIQLFERIRITHLHNVAIIRSEVDITMFEYFTSITHLTFPYPSNENLIPLLLTKLPTVEVLVILDGNYADVDGISVYKSSVDDSRVVNIACQDDKEVDEWLLDVVQDRKKVLKGGLSERR
ncbi:hypothetical protein BDN72DRAFT_883935 [Pluteus cervinus]|uniref:Uncharacterized protein n=1 Tax=Pluteus cervinus TaxID=181527 RepID=A0ACD3A2C6_9AGAR|nr:hypothetical protein BDN72DRAFT_883935 [Pluteus cervinus]